MFKWIHEFSAEVDISLSKVWNFCINPHNWPQWIDQFESCEVEGQIKTGSIIKAKIKNRAIYVPILVKDVQLFNSCELFIKAPLFQQEATLTIKTVSLERTAFIIKTSVSSILAPLMTGFFKRRVEKSNKKFLKALVENAKQISSPN